MAGTEKASQPTGRPPQAFYSFFAGSDYCISTAWHPLYVDYYGPSGTAVGSFATAPRTGILRVYRAVIGAKGQSGKTAYCRLYNKSTGQQIYQISVAGAGGWTLNKQQGDPLALLAVSIGNEIFAQIRTSELYAFDYLFGGFTVSLV